jgi:hypothetical protein
MDTKRKILLALGLRFEDKDQVFPPMSAFANMGLGESMHAPAPVPVPTHGNGDGHGQGPTNPPHSF